MAIYEIELAGRCVRNYVWWLISRVVPTQQGYDVLFSMSLPGRTRCEMRVSADGMLTI